VVCDIDLTAFPNDPGLPLSPSTSVVREGTVGPDDQFFITAEFQVNNTLNIGLLGARVDYTTDTVAP
jgi:hypothetical protein